MAIIYIDNILGDDTNTGLTSSSPLKSINAGFQIAVDGDELRVAGGSFSQLPGFITNTARNTTVQTSDDYSALGLTAGDTIAIDTQHLDNWPIEYSTWPVATVGTSSLTFTSNYYLPIGSGTYSVWMFKSGSATQSYHYQGTSTSGEYETISSFTASALKVSGGWNSTFDDQWGWTGVKSGTPAGYSGRKLFNISGYKPNIVFDKFFFSNCLFNAQGSSSFGFDRLKQDFCGSNWFVDGGNSGLAGPSASNFSLPMTRIVNGCQTSGLGSNVNAGGFISSFQVILWQSVSSTSNNQQFVWSGGFGNSKIRHQQINYRNLGESGGGNNSGMRVLAGNYFLCDETKIYQYGGGHYPIYFQTNLGYKLKNFQFFDPDNSGSGLRQRWIGSANTAETDVGLNSFNLIEYNGIIEDLPWKYPTDFTIGDFGVLAAGPYATCNTRIKDNEGYKLLSNWAQISYADSSTYSTGSQSIRYNIPTNPTGFTGKTHWQYIGVTERPTNNFTMSVTLKTNISALTASSFRMIWSGDNNTSVFSPSGSYEIATNLVLNQNWQTFTYSINKSSLKFDITDSAQAGSTVKTMYDYDDFLEVPLFFGLSYAGNVNIGLTSSILVWLGDIKIIQ